MPAIDISLLIYASRDDVQEHARYRPWFDALLASGETIHLPDVVAAGFVRIATNAKIYKVPYTAAEALAVIDDLRSRRNCRWLTPGDAHWTIFSGLCRMARASGPRISDTWLAAMAIERNIELFSADSDFAHFPGLRWRHPLKALP